MTDIKPELIEKALREFVKPRMTTNMALDGVRANLAAALSAVADDLRAEALEDMARFANCVYRNSLVPRTLVLGDLRERAAKLRGADQ